MCTHILTASLRYRWHVIKCTCLKCTIWLFLIYVYTSETMAKWYTPDSEHTHSSPKFPHAPSHTSFLLLPTRPHPSATLDHFLSQEISLRFLKSYVIGIIQNSFLSAFFCSVIFIYVVCTSPLFLLIAVQHAVVWMYHTVCSPVSGHWVVCIFWPSQIKLPPCWQSLDLCSFPSICLSLLHQSVCPCSSTTVSWLL